MHRTLFSFLAVLSLMAGCASLEKRQIDDLVDRYPPEPLQLSIQPEYYSLRVDLVRKIMSTPPTVINGIVAPGQQVDMPYHVVGVGLGNGIVFDLKKNLYFDLGSLLEIKDKDNFSIREGTNVSYVRRGAEFKRTTHSLVNTTDSVVTFNGNKVTVKQGLLQALLRDSRRCFFHNKCDITIEPDGLLYDPHGLLGAGKTKISQDTSGAITIPGFFSDRTFKMVGENKIVLDGILEVTRHDDRIEICHRDLFGTGTPMTFIKTKDGIAFMGIEVKKTSDGVEVYRDGSLETKYELNNLESM